MSSRDDAVEEFHQFMYPELEERQILGSGAEGAVYRGNYGTYGIVAMKIFHMNVGQYERREIEHIRKFSNHPNLVRFYGPVLEHASGSIIGYAMEYVPQSLHSVIHNNVSIYTLADVLNWGRQASLGLNWLHTVKEVIHRDVKPNNLLLLNGTVKICDFGATREAIERSMSLGVGTPSYMAPELMSTTADSSPYDNRCDVYSMGVTLWEMATRTVPFFHWVPPFNCLAGDCSSMENVPCPRLRQIILSCVERQPRLRPSMKQLHDILLHTQPTNLSQLVAPLQSVEMEPSEDLELKNIREKVQRAINVLGITEVIVLWASVFPGLFRSDLIFIEYVGHFVTIYGAMIFIFAKMSGWRSAVLLLILQILNNIVLWCWNMGMFALALHPSDFKVCTQTTPDEIDNTTTIDTSTESSDRCQNGARLTAGCLFVLGIFTFIINLPSWTSYLKYYRFLRLVENKEDQRRQLFNEEELEQV